MPSSKSSNPEKGSHAYSTEIRFLSRMGRLGGCGLTASAISLSLVALLVNSPGLFYMSTAIIVTILVGRLQAWISVGWLKVQRIAPSQAHVGELVTVETVVWSERRFKRPLVTLVDNLPGDMPVDSLSPSLPIAPSPSEPIRSQYRFRPLRRGHYSWSGVTVIGIDALGITSISKRYPTETTDLLVVPTAIPLLVDAPIAGGLGISEAGSGQARGGLEPRGIREYAPGDSIRHIHWRSTARTGLLLVKEFEAGSQALFGILLQRARASDIGKPPLSSLDLMCGNALHLAQELRRGGAEAVFPQLEAPERRERSAGRTAEIERMLADVRADSDRSVAAELLAAREARDGGNVFYVMLSLADPLLPNAVATLSRTGSPVTVLLYDPQKFVPGRRSMGSAVDPDYIDSLTAAGAQTVIVPFMAVEGSA